MTSYSIYRWDPVLLNNSVVPSAMIYIKPDKELLDFILANNNTVMLTISGTNGLYDGDVVGIVNNLASNTQCNERPVMFEKTGYYTVMLYSDWKKYPETMGSVVVSGLRRPTSSQRISTSMNDTDSDNNTTTSLTTSQLLITGVCLVLILLLTIS